MLKQNQKGADNGQLQAGGYREQNPGNAADQNKGSIEQARNVGTDTPVETGGIDDRILIGGGNKQDQSSGSHKSGNNTDRIKTGKNGVVTKYSAGAKGKIVTKTPAKPRAK